MFHQSFEQWKISPVFRFPGNCDWIFRHTSCTLKTVEICMCMQCNGWREWNSFIINCGLRWTQYGGIVQYCGHICFDWQPCYLHSSYVHSGEARWKPVLVIPHISISSLMNFWKTRYTVLLVIAVWIIPTMKVILLQFFTINKKNSTSLLTYTLTKNIFPLNFNNLLVKLQLLRFETVEILASFSQLHVLADSAIENFYKCLQLQSKFRNFVTIFSNFA